MKAKRTVTVEEVLRCEREHATAGRAGIAATLVGLLPAGVLLVWGGCGADRTWGALICAVALVSLVNMIWRTWRFKRAEAALWGARAAAEAALEPWRRSRALAEYQPGGDYWEAVLAELECQQAHMLGDCVLCEARADTPESEEAADA